MPTTLQRRLFVKQAIHLFNKQDYPNKELIIVDSGEGDTRLCLDIPIQPNIQDAYVNIEGLDDEYSLTVGAKRNLACALSTGSILCFFDDDDWYSSDRLSRQVEPLLRDEADVTGMTLDAVLHLQEWRVWRPSSLLRREIFPYDVHTGTLMFYRSLWHAMPLPNKSIGEDADFLRRLVASGARLQRVENDNTFVYIRHGASTWPLPPHKHEHMEDWREGEVGQCMTEENRAFYETVREVKI